MTASSPAEAFVELEKAEAEVMRRLIFAHRSALPRNVNCKYTVVQHNGKVSIRMERLYEQ